MFLHLLLLLLLPLCLSLFALWIGISRCAAEHEIECAVERRHRRCLAQRNESTRATLQYSIFDIRYSMSYYCDDPTHFVSDYLARVSLLLVRIRNRGHVGAPSSGKFQRQVAESADALITFSCFYFLKKIKTLIF